MVSGAAFQLIFELQTLNDYCLQALFIAVRHATSIWNVGFLKLNDKSSV